VADKPYGTEPLVGAARDTVIPVALAPTAPDQHCAHDWLKSLDWLAREVHVTEPPDAEGLAPVSGNVDDAADARTTIKSPTCTSKAVVTFGLVALE